MKWRLRWLSQRDGSRRRACARGGRAAGKGAAGGVAPVVGVGASSASGSAELVGCCSWACRERRGLGSERAVWITIKVCECERERLRGARTIR